MRRYDEAALVARLAAASPRARALFAALIAERLFPLYEHFAATADDGDPARLREALDTAWAALDGDVPAAELEREQAVAEALVPAEDDGWHTTSAYGQNAAAAVAYALRTRLTDDAQEAAWAARQAYDAADYAAQQQLEDLAFSDPGAEDALAGRPVVQEALAGIDADLAGALSDPPPVPELREDARRGGTRLVELA